MGIHRHERMNFWFEGDSSLILSTSTPRCVIIKILKRAEPGDVEVRRLSVARETRAVIKFKLQFPRRRLGPIFVLHGRITSCSKIRKQAVISKLTPDCIYFVYVDARSPMYPSR